MLTKEKSGLIVVDVQGKLATIVDDSERYITNLVKLVKAAKLLELPILWLEQNPEKLRKTVPDSTDALASISPITKYTFSGCGEPAFVEAVKKAKVNTWLVSGIETHICVYQTSLELLNMGYMVELVSDCVSSRAVSNKELALAKLARKGAEVTSLEMCLFELIKDCRSDQFKEALNLIK